MTREEASLVCPSLPPAPSLRILFDAVLVPSIVPFHFSLLLHVAPSRLCLDCAARGDVLLSVLFLLCAYAVCVPHLAYCVFKIFFLVAAISRALHYGWTRVTCSFT